MIRRLALIFLAAGASLFMPSAAQAAVTIGNSLTATTVDRNGSCGFTFDPDPATCLVVETMSGGSPVVSPINGVVVSWTTRQANGASQFFGSYGTLRLRVIEDSGSGFYKPLRSGPDTFIPLAASGYPLITTPIVPGLPISAGNLVGIGVRDATSAVAQCNTAGLCPGTSFETKSWTIDYADGVSAGTPNDTATYKQSLYQARVESDADGDGYGDETQDQCPTNGGTAGPCPSGGVGNPTSPINPAGNIRKRKCKKSNRSATVAKKKCKKK